MSGQSPSQEAWERALQERRGILRARAQRDEQETQAEQWKQPALALQDPRPGSSPNRQAVVREFSKLIERAKERKWRELQEAEQLALLEDLEEEDS